MWKHKINKYKNTLVHIQPYTPSYSSTLTITLHTHTCFRALTTIHTQTHTYTHIHTHTHGIRSSPRPRRWFWVKPRASMFTNFFPQTFFWVIAKHNFQTKWTFCKFDLQITLILRSWGQANPRFGFSDLKNISMHFSNSITIFCKFDLQMTLTVRSWGQSDFRFGFSDPKNMSILNEKL